MTENKSKSLLGKLGLDDATLDRIMLTTAKMQEAYESKYKPSPRALGNSIQDNSRNAQDPTLPERIEELKKHYANVPDGLFG